MGAVGGGEVHDAAKLPARSDVRWSVMGRGLAAGLVLATALIVPTTASAQDAKPSKRCDFTDPAVCLYPWPNDLFTRSDDAPPPAVA